MIIFSAALFSLGLSLFTPWYMVIAMAAGMYSFRKKAHGEILKVSFLIFVFHMVAAFILDAQSGYLISQRMTGLFALPWQSLFYILPALSPALLFVITSYTVIEARNLVQRTQRKSEKKR